jgi:hypothetical protein
LCSGVTLLADSAPSVTVHAARGRLRVARVPLAVRSV